MSFQEAKRSLTHAPILVHYDPELPLVLAADASAYGLGAVISHTMPDGSERLIAFASRTLAASEQNYAQIDREALLLVFGVKKFHSYLFGPKQGVPSLAAARMELGPTPIGIYL
jgi:hypothetical protein